VHFLPHKLASVLALGYEALVELLFELLSEFLFEFLFECLEAHVKAVVDDLFNIFEREIYLRHWLNPSR
jgi:hypothetical protein